MFRNHEGYTRETPWREPDMDETPTEAETATKIRAKIVRAPGRPRISSEPLVTTTVRVTLSEYQYCRDRHLQFTALLRSRIHTLQVEEQSNPQDVRSQFVRAARLIGIGDQMIGQLLRENPAIETEGVPTP